MATIPTTVTPGVGNWIWQNQYGDMSFSAQAGSTQPDSYRFHADVGGSYAITVGGFIDSQFRVYNSSGSPVTQVINNGGFGTSETTNFTATTDSWYYVQVAGVGTGTGIYTLSVNGPDLVRNTISLSNSTNTASASGTVNPAGDIDYFAFVAPSGTSSLNLTVTPDAGTGLNTWVELYSNAGTLLQEITNGGAGSANSASNIAVTAGVTYWLGVSSASSTQTGGYTVSVDFNPDSSSAFTVSGKFEYQDKDYNQNGLTGTSNDPIRYATVEIWEDDVLFDNRLGTTFTAADGSWSFIVPDNNDPSGRDIYVKVIADTAAGTVTNASGTTYVYTGPTVNNWQGGAMWYDANPLDGSNQAVRPATDEYNAAFNILDQAIVGYQYLINDGISANALGKASFIFYQSEGSFTDRQQPYAITINSIDWTSLFGLGRFYSNDGFDDAVILHEYGHFVANKLSYIAANAGGAHSWDSHNSSTQAWSEGWASFFSSAARNSNKYYVDTWNTGSYYVNLEDGSNNAGIDSTKFFGDDNEAAVAMVLWDIFDSTNETHDSMSAGIDEILNIIDNPAYFSASTSDTLYDLYSGWRDLHYSNLDGLREILGFREIFYWPVVTSISDSPDPVTTSGGLTLTANIITTHNALANVSFYRESNGTSGLQIGSGGDALVGTDTAASNGWSVSVNTAGLASGTYTYYALATDTAGDISATGANVHSTTNTVNGPVNHAPMITSNGSGDTASILVAENSSAVTTVTANDQDAGTVFTYSLSGGADLAKFQINALTGALSFINAPNFEAPSSAAGSNSYVVQVRVADNGNPILTDVQTITVNVTDVNEQPNRAPQISFPNGTNIPANAGQSLAASSLFSASDADGDPLTYFFQDGTPAANSGRFVLNGTALAQGAAFNVSAAQLAQLRFVAGSIDDDLSMQLADDKGALSSAAGFHIHVNRAPVLSVPATVTANASQSLLASSLFSASDADGDALTYFFQDSTSAANSGRFVLNGTALAQGAAFNVSAAQLAQLRFLTGSIDDDLSMQLADDKGALSAAAGFHIHVNRAPVLSVPATVTANASQSLLASSLFSASDADGDALTYFFQDSTSAANSGRFVLNGTALAQGAAFNVSAAQLAQLRFLTGSIDDDLSMQLADDKGALSAAAGFHIHVNRAPVLGVPGTVTANAGQSLLASGLFSASDADGDPLTYFFQDGTSAANSGRFVLNGTALAQGAAFNVSAAQLAQLRFVAGSIDDDLSMQLADDKGALSAAAGFHIHVNRAPVLGVPGTVTANAGQSLLASGLFSASDADGDPLTYFFQDGTSAANSGRFVLNGTPYAQGAAFNVSAAQLAQLRFVAGSIDDDLSMQLADDKGALSSAAGFHIHVNRAPVLSVPATVTANASQSLLASSLFSASDADGDPLTYFFQDGTSAANSGRFVLNGTALAQGAAFNVSAAQLAQLRFVAGSIDDDLSMQLADDKGALSSAAGFHIHVNRAPVLSVPATVTANASQSLLASSLFSASDADGDPLTYFFQDSTSAANSGRFVLNGTALAQGAAFNVSATQLAQLSFVAGSIDDDLSMQLADDKGALSAAAGFHVHVNRAPVLSVPATVTANASQSLLASSLFSAADADGDALTYFFQDGTPAANSGRFVLNGTPYAQGAAFNVSAAQLAQLSFVAGSIDDDLSMQLADDKGALSAAAGFHIHVNRAPVLGVPTTVTANASQSLAASSMFNATDADGDPLTYFFQDGTPAANSGRFVLNGTPYAQGAAFNVSATQLAQLSFVAGSIDDDLSMQLADDKGALSSAAGFHVHINHAPVLTVPGTATANAGQSLAASSLFSASDADGDPLTYFFQDGTSTANSGRFVLNGTPYAQGAAFNVSAAQLAQLSFVAGSIDDDLSMQLADDKGALSSAAGFHVHINHAPVLTVPGTATANAGQSLLASSLFSASDADGDPLTYFFQDGTSTANSGRFVLNGTPYAQGAAFNVSAAQLAQLSFAAGSVNDDLSMQLADDKGALSAAAGFHFHVNQAPVLTVPGTVMASANQSLQASSLFSASDADGDTLTYFFQDGTVAANSGHFVLNATAIAQGAAFHVTGAAQLAQLSFVTGSVDDDLSMQVADDHGALSAGAGFHILV